MKNTLTYLVSGFCATLLLGCVAPTEVPVSETTPRSVMSKKEKTGIAVLRTGLYLAGLPDCYNHEHYMKHRD